MCKHEYDKEHFELNLVDRNNLKYYIKKWQNRRKK